MSYTNVILQATLFSFSSPFLRFGLPFSYSFLLKNNASIFHMLDCRWEICLCCSLAWPVSELSFLDWGYRRG